MRQADATQYYRLTKAGKARLAEQSAQWQAVGGRWARRISTAARGRGGACMSLELAFPPSEQPSFLRRFGSRR